MDWKNPPKHLDHPEVELRGDVLSPNQMYEHRDTGTFDPTKDVPAQEQFWGESWWDNLVILVDPTGAGRVTDTGFPPPTQLFGKQITILGKEFNTISQAAEYAGQSPDKVRRLIRSGRLEEVEKMVKEAKAKS